MLVGCAGRDPATDAAPTGLDAGTSDAGANFDAANTNDDAGSIDVDAGDDAGDVDAGADAGGSDAGGADAGDVDGGAQNVDAGAPPAHEGVSLSALQACAIADDGDVKVAIIVSLDGLKSAALTLDPTRVPTLTALRSAGASTLDARTDPTFSVTLPNHTGMVTGRPVDGPDGHHVVGNSYSNVTVHTDRGGYTASIFDVAHDRGLTTVMAASKSKFLRLVNSYNPGANDTIGIDNGPNKIDIAAVGDQTDVVTMDAVVLALHSLGDVQRALVFVHLKAADAAGHGSGFDAVVGSPYFAAVEQDDVQLTRLANALVQTPSLCGTTTLLLTTDHGGHGYGHSDAMDAQNYTVPFIAYGPRAQVGADLVMLNPTHSPIRNIDVGNLALDQLGLPAVPGSVIDAAFDLRTR